MCRSLVLIASAALLLASCRDNPAVPTFTASATYGPPVDPETAFKDEAPPNRNLTPGELALRFIDHEGKQVDLTDFRGKQTVVLVVTRGIPESPGGVFCPHCIAQVSSLAANNDAFEKRSAKLLFVFPGPSERVRSFIQHAKAQALEDARPPGATSPFLLDRDVAVCTRLGIRADLAKPSTFIIDRQGNVVYAFVGETTTDRPSVKALLGQLDKLGVAPGSAPP